MKKILIIGLFLFGVMGIYFLGSGITGFVVSETCCFPPNCAVEKQCQFWGQENDTKEKVFGGAGLLILSGLLYGLWYRKRDI